MRVGLLLSAVLLAGSCIAQEEPAAEIDMARPRAVVEAYLEACQAGDMDTAMSLVTGDEHLIERLKDMVGEITSDVGGVEFPTMLRELSLLPVGMSVKFEMGEGDATSAEQGISAAVSLPMKPTFKLVQGEDGRWLIDIEKTLESVSPDARSFIVSMARGEPPFARGRGTSEDRGPPQPWERQNSLRKLSSELRKYAQENDGRLPEADTWMDELHGFVLDKAILQRPGTGTDEYGYAFNEQLSGQELPRDWQQRQNTVLIYESEDTSWNAAGDPYEALLPTGEGNEVRYIALASGNTAGVPDDIGLNEAFAEWRQSEECRDRLSVLLEALLDHARDNGGMLPEGDEWSEAIVAYLEPERLSPETFTCPGRPDSECGWAINSALAGRDITEFTHHEDYVLLIPCDDCRPNEAMELPERVENAPHLYRWSSDAHRTVNVGMLSGSVNMRPGGQPYPRPPEAAE